MKRMLFLTAALLSSLVSFSQEDQSSISLPPDTTSIEVAENTFHTGKTKDVGADKPATKLNKKTFSKVYKVPSRSAMDIYSMAITFAQQRNLSYSSSTGNRTVKISLPITYQGAQSDCIQSLDMQGILTIQAKDSKTKVALENLTYQNGNGAEPIVKKTLLSKDEQCAPAAGNIEALYNCTGCKQSLNSLSTALENELERYASQYISFLQSQ